MIILFVMQLQVWRRRSGPESLSCFVVRSSPGRQSSVCFHHLMMASVDAAAELRHCDYPRAATVWLLILTVEVFCVGAGRCMWYHCVRSAQHAACGIRDRISLKKICALCRVGGVCLDRGGVDRGGGGVVPWIKLEVRPKCSTLPFNTQNHPLTSKKHHFNDPG